MNSKTFVVFGSFVLLLWLGLSFFTEIKPSPSPITPVASSNAATLRDLVSSEDVSSRGVDDAAP